jgi:hypothetical protein
VIRPISDVQNFDNSKRILTEKLRNLDLQALNLSDYSKKYMTFLIDDIGETLGRFEQVIREAISHSKKDVSQLTLVDYGGGVGLLSLLAREIGFKSVIYNDIFEGSCDDVRTISEACSLKLDRIIRGDATDLVYELNTNALYADLIVSYDVIEHVYDVKANFLAFSQLKSRPITIVYGSGANIRNPFYTRRVKKDQIRVENHERQRIYGHKPTDSLNSYLAIRRNIILHHAPQLKDPEVDFLAISSRGLIESDIKSLTDEYQQTGQVSYKINHPTNTCDPKTGNWCEHLLDFNWLQSIAQKAGFSADFSKGKYSPRGFSLRNVTRWVFNLANRGLGPFGFAFSPFYILTLKPSTED